MLPTASYPCRSYKGTFHLLAKALSASPLASYPVYDLRTVRHPGKSFRPVLIVIDTLANHFFCSRLKLR